MALVFLHDMPAAARCAIDVAVFLRKYPAIQLRMGVNVGQIVHQVDVNDTKNVSGEGINVAQRVMDAGDAGHILVSQTVAEILSGDDEWSDALQDLGLREVKHGVLVHLYNLCRKE